MRKRTGETCVISGYYDWDGYLDGTRTPLPTSNERTIPMQPGKTFPPVHSSNKGAWWKIRS